MGGCVLQIKYRFIVFFLERLSMHKDFNSPDLKEERKRLKAACKLVLEELTSELEPMITKIFEEEDVVNAAREQQEQEELARHQCSECEEDSEPGDTMEKQEQPPDAYKTDEYPGWSGQPLIAPTGGVDLAQTLYPRGRIAASRPEHNPSPASFTQPPPASSTQPPPASFTQPSPAICTYAPTATLTYAPTATFTDPPAVAFTDPPPPSFSEVADSPRVYALTTTPSPPAPLPQTPLLVAEAPTHAVSDLSTARPTASPHSALLDALLQPPSQSIAPRGPAESRDFGSSPPSASYHTPPMDLPALHSSTRSSSNTAVAPKAQSASLSRLENLTINYEMPGRASTTPAAPQASVSPPYVGPMSTGFGLDLSIPEHKPTHLATSTIGAPVPAVTPVARNWVSR